MKKYTTAFVLIHLATSTLTHVLAPIFLDLLKALRKPTVCLHEQEVSRYVVEGQNIEITDAPWTALIKTKDEENIEKSCNGVIISKWHILTAAGCVEELEPQQISYGAGKTCSDGGMNMYPIIKYSVHPNYTKPVYKDDKFAYDIALINVAPMLFGPAGFSLVAAIDMLKVAPRHPTPVTVTGWGLIDLNPPVPADHLREVNTYIAPQSFCGALWSKSKPGVICAYDNTRKISVAFKAYRGGALVLRYMDRSYLVGLVHRTHKIRKLPTKKDPFNVRGFMSVPYFRNWILEEAGFPEEQETTVEQNSPNSDSEEHF